jgi:preprotein translocase SecE subunit
VARDRKRAKQRRDRGRAPAVRGSSATGAPPAPAPAAAPLEPDGLERVDVPGPLDHASSDVDEFDAALVRGAGGTPVDNELAEQAFGADDELQAPGDSGGGRSGRGGHGGGAGGGGAGGGPGGGELASQPSGAPLRGGNRAVGFIRASWAELQRVQWPDRRAVTQATAVVIGFVAIAGAYLGLADFVAKEIVEFIL